MKNKEGLIFGLLFFGLIYIPLIISIPVHFILQGELIRPCSGMGDCASFINYDQSFLMSFLIEMIFILLFFIHFIFFRFRKNQPNNGVAKND
jgi:hypothetical protein